MDADDIMELLEMAAAPAATAAITGAINMVMPMLMSSAPSSGSAPSNFAGPQPGTPGGGFLPTAIANPTVIAGNSIFAGLGLVGAGQLVALFDLPVTNANFGAISGIFEEANGQRRGKRELREQIISFAKFLLWINQTIDQGQSKISRYIAGREFFIITIISLEQYLIFCCIICSFFMRKLFKKFQKEQPEAEQLYGLFADITLVDNEQCNLIPDTCSKFDPFLSLPYRSQNRIQRSYANSYRRQGETEFSFTDPNCNRSCLRF